MLGFFPALVIIFLSFFTNALTGFGGGLLSVPFLAFFYPLVTVSPLVNVLGLTANSLLVSSVYKQAKYSVLIPLLVGNMLGSYFGITVLKITPNELLLNLLGILIILFAFNLIRTNKVIIPEHTVVSVIIGALSGILSALYAVGGPPLVLYLASIIHKKDTLRSTLILFFFINGITQLPLIFMKGLLTLQVLQLTLICLPVLVLASFIGHSVHLSTSEVNYKRIVFVVLLTAGVMLLFKNV